ncbi:MAG: family 10 glycosylhydrolase [Bacteroidetes bacterium]|nr:family 10 glycosylhydrolase [Bacteroidota bacterium]MCL5737617.1 family 10 glycosylhydrolase [Bacteroidota bacterium]
MRYLLLVLLFVETSFTGVSSAQLSNSRTERFGSRTSQDLIFGLAPPKRELRGAWIATVVNIDWPSQPGLPSSQQQAQLISILDQLKSMGINAVFFQIRPECDALYQSSIEPWSYWLTGKQGQPPIPFYDPLQFAIQEAHKRGMELHAWFNPYRALRDTSQVYDVPDSTHVTVRHPDWILKFGKLKILNPGLPQVRDYITSVIMDVVRRYDIDGVHFDDYFYPYEGITTQDTAAFRLYNRGFTDIGDWRRDNVNLFVKEVHDSIQAVKPWVKFGISPFGIWKSGVPSGTSGLDAYSVLYADAMTWLQRKTVDYLAPQLYWPNGGGQDYAKLMPWWADSAAANGRHIYIGQAAYRIPNWTSGEMERQLIQNRSNPDVQGSIFFNTTSLTSNLGNFSDSLRQYYYRYPALVPSMGWKDVIPPNAPQNLRYQQIASAPPQLYWDVPVTASDGDTASRYVVYRFNHFPQAGSSTGISSADIESAQNILSVVGVASSNPVIPSGSGPYYYTVTALDRNWNESQRGKVIPVYSPSVPLLASPSNNFMNARDTTVLQWQSPPLTASYSLQVSADSTFSQNLLVNLTGITDTSFAVTGMNGRQKYFWRLSAGNAGGRSGYSDACSFTTGFPIAPLLAGPANLLTNAPLLPVFTWHPTNITAKYRLQLSKSVDFSSLVVDTTIASPDTSLTMVDSLSAYTIYNWRVSSGNPYGFSLWSSAWRFRTAAPTWVASTGETPTQFGLLQNYPNPFNPTTTIKFRVASSGFVSLKVYDVLGREVATLVNEQRNAGSYSVTFDGSKLPSGVYFYRLAVNGFMSTKSMVLVK